MRGKKRAYLNCAILTWTSLHSTHRRNFVSAFFSDIKEKRNFHNNCLSSPLNVRVGGYLRILCIDLTYQKNTVINKPLMIAWNIHVQICAKHMVLQVKLHSRQKYMDDACTCDKKIWEAGVGNFQQWTLKFVHIYINNF